MLRVAALVVVLILLPYPTLAQDRQTAEEHYSAVAMGTGGPMGGRSLQFDFLERYASDEQVNSFARLLKDRGQDALRSALEREDVGRISPVGSVGNQIARARKRRIGSDTMIVVVTARNMPFLELYRSVRTTDYPFGFLQVKLNGKGEGAGQIMAAAKIRFNKKSGHYEIESYGNHYIKAANVEPLK